MGDTPKRASDKAAWLAAKRWRHRERTLLAVALEDGKTYTLSEVQEALKRLERRAVR